MPLSNLKKSFFKTNHTLTIIQQSICPPVPSRTKKYHPKLLLGDRRCLQRTEVQPNPPQYDILTPRQETKITTTHPTTPISIPTSTHQVHSASKSTDPENGKKQGMPCTRCYTTSVNALHLHSALHIASCIPVTYHVRIHDDTESWISKYIASHRIALHQVVLQYVRVCVDVHPRDGLNALQSRQI